MRRLAKMTVVGLMLIMLVSLCGCTDRSGKPSLDDMIEKQIYKKQMNFAEEVGETAESFMAEEGESSIYQWVITLMESKENIVGTWKIQYDMGELIVTEMGDEYADLESNLVIILKYEFTDDGEYKMYADDSFRENFRIWLEDVCEYSVETMYVMYEERGISREEVDSLLEDEFGMSLTEYFVTTMEAELDIEAMMEDMIMEGEYEYKNGKLFLSDEYGNFSEYVYDICTISGDTMLLEDPTGSEIEILPGLAYPLELERD